MIGQVPRRVVPVDEMIVVGVPGIRPGEPVRGRPVTRVRDPDEVGEGEPTAEARMDGLPGRDAAQVAVPATGLG